jgi:hypothetical protein
VNHSDKACPSTFHCDSGSTEDRISSDIANMPRWEPGKSFRIDKTGVALDGSSKVLLGTN